MSSDIHRKKISVAIAVFNGGQYIQEQLTSIVNQSFPPDEVIISDDNSSDKTISIAKMVLEKHKIKFRIVKNKYPRGFSNNFQTAMEYCSGDIIFLSDQDDFWFTTKIKNCVDKLNGDNKQLLLHNMYIGDEKLALSKKTYFEEMASYSMGLDDYCSGCAMAMKKELLNIVIPFPCRIKDHDIWINEISKYINQRTLLTAPLSIYRRHGSNLTTNKIFTPGFLKNIFMSYREQKAGVYFFRQKMLNEEILERFKERHGVVNFYVNADEIIKKIETKIQVLNFRIECKKLNVFLRIHRVAHSYSKYEITFLQAIKDILVGITNTNHPHY